MKQGKQIIEIVESFYDIGTVTAVFEIFGGFNSRGIGLMRRSTENSGDDQNQALRSQPAAPVVQLQ